MEFCMLSSSKFLLLASVAVMLTGTASAADLGTYAQIPPDYHNPPAFQWSGAYGGVHAGLASPKVNPFASGRGFVGGVQAGYNWQFGPGLLGAEVEGSWLGNTKVNVPGGHLQERFRGAAKARAGLTFDQTLFYGTAGLSMTKYKGGNGVTVQSGWKQGYILGAGIEQGFGGGLSARLEYNRVLTTGVTTSSGGTSSKTDLRDNVFKAGLNYRF